MTWLGLAVLLGYCVHAGYHLWHRRPEDLLWVCHLAAVAVGIGLAARWPTWNAIGVLILTIGVPIWLLDLTTGGQFMPTSLLTHVFGLVAGVYGVRQMGMPAQSWWKAVLFCVALVVICRWSTPASANVNVAFAVRGSANAWFASYAWYLVVLGLSLTASLFVAEQVYRRWVQP
jgi:hypothetical protein